jgi:mannose-6-phosphate isomerase
VKTLDNPIRAYAWGSRTAIAALRGRPVPSETPEAEMWIGAHPDDPSHIDGIGLDKLVEAAPEYLIGPTATRRFGARLPYLLKILAAAAPLSIQVHPDAVTAATRYAAEQRARIDRSDPRRRYLDPHHKPEMLVAVTRFEALCGFRDPADVARDLAPTRIARLRPIVRALDGGDIASALATVLRWPAATCRETIAAALDARSELPDPQAELLDRLAGAYPDDPGVIVALMLRRVVLEPGEAVFIAAGQLHSYVSGVGVEAMASSDNVIRGGLTTKPVDVDELLTTVRCVPGPDPRIAPTRLSETVEAWPVPVADFRLRRVRHAGPGARTVMALSGPRIVLCVRGAFEACDAAGTVRLGPGEAGFSAAVDGEIGLTGAGEAFVVSL